MTLTQNHIIQARYSIMALLGQGGFGAVYKAWDVNLSKPVAIKENLDISPEAQRQFTHEAQILSGLSHPNLPRVTDHFLMPGAGQCLVMDFVDGEDLQTMLNRQSMPFTESQVSPWIEQVCDALEYLHTRTPPIIHRDIKPANIKITSEGRAVLVDFGISKILNPASRTTLGARAVTPGYSAPEQYGHGMTDQRSDVYSLGATLYTLLTGQEPPESIDRLANDVPLVAPRQIIPAISPGLESAILRACELTTTRRLIGVKEFRQSLSGAPSVAGQQLPPLVKDNLQMALVDSAPSVDLRQPPPLVEDNLQVMQPESTPLVDLQQSPSLVEGNIGVVLSHDAPSAAMQQPPSPLMPDAVPAASDMRQRMTIRPWMIIGAVALTIVGALASVGQGPLLSATPAALPATAIHIPTQVPVAEQVTPTRAPTQRPTRVPVSTQVAPPRAPVRSSESTVTVRSNFDGTCRIVLWGPADVTMDAGWDQSPVRTVVPGTYGWRAFVGGHETGQAADLVVSPGAQCSFFCDASSNNVSWGCQ